MKLPIYLVEIPMIDNLPPEQIYSTYPPLKGRIIGYIISENQLTKEYRDRSGAIVENKGFYPTRVLIRCAKLKEYGLKWEDANVCE